MKKHYKETAIIDFDWWPENQEDKGTKGDERACPKCCDIQNTIFDETSSNKSEQIFFKRAK